MSVIVITHHNENIYNITKEAHKYTKKSPRYVSRHDKGKSKYSTTLMLGQYVIKQCATMGRPEETLPDPCDFLRKKSGLERKVVFDDRNKHVCIKIINKKPRVYPTRDEIKQYNERRAQYQPKNYISKNIKFVLSMKPKDPEKKVVIDRYGDSKPLSRGLEPIYIKDAVYGKTPEYLERFIKVRQKAYQQQKDATGLEQPKCRYITREEREKLLNGLKQNWEELQKQYQGLPILTDTIPKKNRKSKMEADLKQLEKDIVLIERHPYIYVYDDDKLD